MDLPRAVELLGDPVAAAVEASDHRLDCIAQRAVRRCRYAVAGVPARLDRRLQIVVHAVPNSRCTSSSHTPTSEISISMKSGLASCEPRSEPLLTHTVVIPS